MFVRRAFFYWQTAAAVVLPVWLLVGWALWGESYGGLLGIALAAPVLVVAVLIVVGLTVARRSVREKKAVSWLDVGILTFWHAMLIGLGFFGPATEWFVVLGVIGAVGAFWSSIWQLVRETRARFRAAFDDIQRTAGAPGIRQTPIDAGELIVLPVRDTDGRRPGS